MRKALVFVLAALVAISGAVVAQDSTPLELGQWVEGNITNEAFENVYTFSVAEDSLVMVEMTQKPGTFDLDPYLILLNSQNNVIAENDDFNYPSTLVMAQVAAGDYSVIATRTGSRTGSSQGEYVLRASQVKPLTAGAKIEIELNDDGVDDLNDLPQNLVIAPTEDGPVNISFNQSISDLYGSLKLQEYDPVSTYGGETLIQLDNTARIRIASFALELEGGKWYVLSVGKSFYSFSFDGPTNVVTIAVE